MNRLSIKQITVSFLIVCLAVLPIPVLIFAETSSFEVNSWDQFVDVVEKATDDITVKVVDDLIVTHEGDVSTARVIGEGFDHTITIIGEKEDGSRPNIEMNGDNLTLKSEFIIKDVVITGITTFNCYSNGSFFNVKIEGNSGQLGLTANNTVSIYAGEFTSVSIPNNATLKLCPQGNISVGQILISRRATNGYAYVIPQSGYPISEFTHADSNEVSTLDDGTNTKYWKGASSALTIKDIHISVTSDSSVLTPTVISTSSITDSTKGAATVTGTVSDGTATLNVTSDKACVVAYTTDDGKTYTRVNAAKADSGYDFVVPNYSDTMKFVVAVKGDVNGDGDTDAADAAVASAYEVGNITSLTSLQKLVADVNLDGSIDSADSAAAKAAEVGNLILPW